VVDKQGVHYDCTRPSHLETLLNSSQDVSVPQQDAALQFMLQNRLSKYNHAPPLNAQLLDDLSQNAQAILVVDQTYGDLSVTYGAANARTFQYMLQTALAENLCATVYLKTHPQTASGHKRGYLTHVPPHPRVVMLTHAVNPMHLLAHMSRVYVVSSTLGFEALLMGKPVVCFGVPWYAGWGATDDRCAYSPAAPRRTRKRSVSELFAAAYLRYSHYLNPITHQRGEVMDVMPWLVLQQQTAVQWHGPQLNQHWVFVGMQWWKRAHMRQFFGLHPKLLTFDVPLQAGDQAVHWGVDAPDNAWRVEDGFVRSVGLGSDLIPPMSLVVDKRGMYFDPSRPSDLEHLLQHHAFTPQELKEAQAVREFIVAHGITKYNLEPLTAVSWPSLGRRVLLVVGQVEDDASVRLGCTFIKTNLGLLKAVRLAHPDAFIVYKPHPDVATGNRKGRVALKQAGQWADHVENQSSVVSCIEACDELHTLTSLSGFDALLRGKPVTTYGLPFYAGWGLTTDKAFAATSCFPRRTRRLSLDELVAGALLRYPVYWDQEIKGVTTCMAVLLRIQTQRDALQAQGRLHHLKYGFWRRQLRKLGHLLA
jgi:capsular polysaccharide export protein